MRKGLWISQLQLTDMDESFAPNTAASCGDNDLGIPSNVLYESFTDAAAHCVAGAYLAVQAFIQVYTSCQAQPQATAVPPHAGQQSAASYGVNVLPAVM